MILETIAALAVSASATPQDYSTRGAPRGDYRQSCSGSYVNRGRLYADCRDDRGRIRETSIELNRCSDHEIRNRDGLLVCGPYRGTYEDRPGGGDGGGWGGGGDWNGRGAMVYRDDGFRGQSQAIQGAVPNMASIGMNDAVSSMRLRGEWTVCTDANFRGDCRTLSGDVGSLRASGLNDRISSMRPGRYNGGGDNGGGWNGGANSISVYRDAIYRGQSDTFSREIPDLRPTGLNDAISSIRVRGTWEVCTDSYFRGQCQRVGEDVPNLEQWGLNDRISSMRPLTR